MELTINGKTYQSTSEKFFHSCQGCTTTSGSELCHTINGHEDCSRYGIIWIKKESTTENKGSTMTKESNVSTKKETTEEPKYTVDEVLGAVEYVYGTGCWDYTSKIKTYLTLQSKPALTISCI